jgi:hypothetical protein
MIRSAAIVIVIAALAGAAAPQAPERVSADQAGLGYEITVYNQNMGLVKDRRSIELKDGINMLEFSDVAAQIDPTSVHFKSLTAPDEVSILEQNYKYDLVSTEKILAKYLGKRIRIRQRLDKEERVLEGTLMSAAGGTVLKTDEGIVLNPAGQIELPDLPEGLIVKPTLVWMLDSGRAGKHDAEVSYITNGLNWHCEYVTVVNQDDSALDLTGWVTIDNQSGASYKNAGLKLIAGDVHRVQEREKLAPPVELRARAGAGPAAPQFEEKAFFEYHMYTLGRRTDVMDNETKQMTLLSASDVQAKKVFVYDGGRAGWYGGDTSEQNKVRVMLEFKNAKEYNLGMPLPKGKIRVYKADQDGSLQFVGEDLIDHTPKDEKLRVFLGNAFDLVGERARMNFSQVSDRVIEEDYEIKLRNHKDATVTITVVEHYWGDWKILSSNFDYVKKDAHTAEFPIEVKPNEEVVLKYSVRTTY